MYSDQKVAIKHHDLGDDLSLAEIAFGENHESIYEPESSQNTYRNSRILPNVGGIAKELSFLPFFCKIETSNSSQP